jgi:pimeloyl-ACP methyl ester carboxylesterase
MGGQVTEARTTEDQVKDLYDLLAQAGIPGPYVLVGHSIAGYNLVLYAYHYPEETVGLVCVDCRAPMFDKDFMDAMGEEQPDESQEIKDARKELTVGLENAEYLDMVASAAQAQKVASLGNVPLVVLVAEKTLTPDPPAGPLDILGGKIWLKSNEELAKLSSRGRIEIVPGVNHGMIITSDALTKAIQEVVDAARQAP